jgi:rhamnosyltransferase
MTAADVNVADKASVAAVVVTWRPGEGFFRSIRAIAAEAGTVIVVDNGSGAETQARLREMASSVPQVDLLLNDDNLGLGAAQNQGIARALERGFAWILLLDDDSVPEPGMTQAMLNAAARCEGRGPIGLLAPLLFDDHGTLRPTLYTLSGRWRVRRVALAAGEIRDDLLFSIASGSLIPADVLRAVGPMRADFFIDYMDFEFAFRLRRAGYRLVGVGDARLRHKLGEPEVARWFGRTVSYASHPARRRYTIYRNRLRVWRGYGRMLPGFVLFDAGSMLIDLGKLLLLERDKVAKLVAILRGVRDGLTG